MVNLFFLFLRLYLTRVKLFESVLVVVIVRMIVFIGTFLKTVFWSSAGRERKWILISFRVYVFF